MGENRTGFILNRIAGKRTTFNWIFYILVLLLGKSRFPFIIIGVIVILPGIFLRIMSAGIIKKNKILTITGPYAICRHPLYLGSLLISLGLVILSANLWVSLYFLLFFPLTYIPTMLMEENFLAVKFDSEYAAYRERTPMLMPKTVKFNLNKFSWKQLRKNGEYANWLVLILLILWISIKSYTVFYQ